MTDSEEEDVREQTIRDLLAVNDRDDLIEMRAKMQQEIEDSDCDREIELLQYRLGILEEAIEEIV